jgi:YidC/Oxa1 family membrane protein insertase
VVQPVFNLLELIYAVVPGHDLGIVIILFTLLVRLALWPLVKKQLHHGRAIKKLQPELKKIKIAAKGDRQKLARLQMELYKEHEIKPFATIGTLIIQLPIFIALYQSVLKITNDPTNLLNFSYQSIRNLPHIQNLSENIGNFNEKFLGLIDLTRPGIGPKGLYAGAFVLAAIGAYAQYHQSRLMIRDNQDSRKLSEILKQSASGKPADQSEVTAAIGKQMMYFLPVMTFFFSLIVPSALALYIMTTSAVGYFQQRSVLGQDIDEMKTVSDKSDKKSVDKDIGIKITRSVEAPAKTKNKKSTPKKRRKR